MRKSLLFVSLIVLMMSANAQGFLHKAAVDGRVVSVRAAINLPQEFTGEYRLGLRLHASRFL